MAYRGLPRPSSAPGAKASTVCHYHLATTDNKMLAHTIHKSKHQPHTLLPLGHPGNPGPPPRTNGESKGPGPEHPESSQRRSAGTDHHPPPTTRPAPGEGHSLRHPTARPPRLPGPPEVKFDIKFHSHPTRTPRINHGSSGSTFESGRL